MRPPLSYYGGKQRLAKTIISMLPEHRVYCEPFAGGAAVFFNKPPSKVEIINDTNGELINFYRVVKHKFEELQKEIEVSLHSRLLWERAREIYREPERHSDVMRAWAVWYYVNAAFGHVIGHGIGFDRIRGITTKNLATKRLMFTNNLCERLEQAFIECDDAVNVIKRFDSGNTFFYIDPPYVDSDQGHYCGYVQGHFDELLDVLSNIKGKFLLSSYPNEGLEALAKKHRWHQLRIVQPICMTSKHGKQKMKTEILTANYPISLTESNYEMTRCPSLEF